MDIQFDGENLKTHGINTGATLNDKTGSKIGDWLVKIGLAKDANSANFLLITGTIVIFSVSIYFFVYGFALPSQEEAPSQDASLEALLKSQKVQNP